MTLVISKEFGATFPRHAWGVVSSEGDDPSTERLEYVFPEDQDTVATDVVGHLDKGKDILGALEDAERLDEPSRNLSFHARKLVLESTEVHEGVTTALYIDPEAAQSHQQIAA